MESLVLRSVTAVAVLLIGTAAAALLLPASDSQQSLFLRSILLIASPYAMVTTGLVLLGLGWLVRLVLAPVELIRHPDDVGYIPIPGRSRADVANEVRRRRKKGDLPPVYPNGWFRVLDSHQVQKGEVKNITIMGEQLAVYRGQDGQSYVLDAYCPHLGANLAVGGRVVNNCLECPFHGWRFRGEDGKCIAIPYAEKVPEFAKIKAWPSCELNGLIYVWYHCDGIDPMWNVPEVEEITTKKWVYRGHTEHYVNAHIEEIPENAADIAHLGHLHSPGIMSGTDLRYTFNKTWDFVKHSWKVDWKPEPEPNKHCSQMFLKHALLLFGKNCPMLNMGVIARQVGPGLVYLIFDETCFGRGVILHSVTPVEPLLQHVSHSIYYQANIPAFIPKYMLRAECIQFERDVTVWNNKKYVSKPLLVKEDSAIQRHRRWFSQFYSENSPKIDTPKESLDW
ncbi:cholesterol 7-desaturase nvd-like isoform X2 [Protopterus annectens]|uniref:cholesterol 7-desaturase nvd-like isoform X2 n=1 Tax=Protopterus annectens TaxID=7888 RepID=UPI001CFC2D58|nr:cholesterol 7-desaturase nvd-like isoform X2 [Protopterus annectens]